jgi:hypothetical protein
MLLRIFLILNLCFHSSVSAQPVQEDIQEVQLFFGQITDLDCCLLLNQGTVSPYRGFLLSPYQLVFLKDTIDTWDAELQLQIEHTNNLCDSKLQLCQTNRNDLLDQVKQELSYCAEATSYLELKNQDLLKSKTVLKASLYIAIPVSIILGIYAGTKF